jgi:hypothetical protein
VPRRRRSVKTYATTDSSTASRRGTHGGGGPASSASPSAAPSLTTPIHQVDLPGDGPVTCSRPTGCVCDQGFAGFVAQRWWRTS